MLNLSEAVTMWNDMATRTGVRKIRGIHPDREKQFKLRMAEVRKNGLDEREIWQEILDRIEVSAFCTGENERDWKANFDFALRPSRFWKILEENYGGDLDELERRRAWRTPPDQRTLEMWRIRLGDKTNRAGVDLAAFRLEKWNEEADGPKPGMHGCQVPAELLTEYFPDHMKRELYQKLEVTG